MRWLRKLELPIPIYGMCGVIDTKTRIAPTVERNSFNDSATQSSHTRLLLIKNVQNAINSFPSQETIFENDGSC